MARVFPRWLHFAVLVLLLTTAPLRAEIVIVLQNGFIEQHKGRVTIDTQFTIDKAHRKPNSSKKDGDLHIAGRAEEVKLPMVAEIVNAKEDRAAVAAIHAAERVNGTVGMSGAWRLWCEHGGSSDHIQGAPVPRAQSTNPDHVFEIHPVTKLDGRSLLSTLKPIEGFETKDAERAFTSYERVRCQILPGEDTTTLITTMAGFNYVEFIMEIGEQAREVDDGVMLLCKVRELNGELLVRNRRMVLVRDSEVERKIRGKPAGTQVRVLGLPRINLSLVSWRVRAAAEGRREVLTWGLPYEMIVVGFYNFVEDEDVPDRTPAVVAPSRFIPRSLTPEQVQKIRVAPPTPSEELDRPSPPSPEPEVKRPSTPAQPNSPTRPGVVVGTQRSRVKADLIEER